MQESGYNPSTELYKRLIVRFVLLAIVVLSIIFILPIVFHMVSPFIFAALVAAIVNWLVNKINKGLARINKKFIVPNRLTTFILNLIVLFVVFILIFSLVSTIVKEAISLTNNIQQNWDQIVDKVESTLDSLEWNDKIPQRMRDTIEGWGEQLYEKIQDPNLIGGLFNTTISTTRYVISATGNILVNILTFILALFFLTADYDGIKDWTKRRVGKRILKPFRILRNSVLSAFGGYLRAQLIIASTAFVYMLAAFIIYGQPYAFLLALILAIIDLIPILGTIAVLLPWGIIELIGGDINRGIFLIILGVGFFLIRKVMEPRVLGSQIGLHPLVALLSIYVGLKFSGFLGALIGPMIVMLLISLSKAGVFENTVSDIKQAVDKVAELLSKGKAKDDSEKQIEQ